MRVLLVSAVLVIPLKRVIEMVPDRWRDSKFCLKTNKQKKTGLPTSSLFSESIAGKGDYFQGLRVGSCLTPWNELSEEMHCWPSKRLYWEGALGWSAAGSGNLRELLFHVAPGLRFYGNQVSVWFVSGQSLWLRGTPGGMCIAQPRWIPARRILGGW